jgi:hypothetical protein
MTLDTDMYLVSRYRMLMAQEIGNDVQKYREANLSIFAAVEKFEEERTVVYEMLLKSAAEKGWNEITVDDAVEVVSSAAKYDLTYENYVDRFARRDRICLYLFGNAIDDTVDVFLNGDRQPTIRLKEGAVDAYLGKGKR